MSTDEGRELKGFEAGHNHRLEEQWPVFVKTAPDGKVFPVYLNGKANNYVSRRRIRETYRKKVPKLTAQHVKPKIALKFNSGARKVYIHFASRTDLISYALTCVPNTSVPYG